MTGGRFRTTHWSVVLRAGGDGADARTALATLCTTYWLPLYAYARRRGHEPADARDLVQGFLCELLEKGWVKDADEDRGRFRGFLATAFRRYAGREHAKETAQKRGGGRTLLTFDAAEGEERYAREPVDDRTPEQVFDRRWALTVIDRALSHARDDYARRGRADDFAALESHLDGTSPAPPYAETAAKLGTSEGAVKVAVHRLRKRFSQHLRAEVGATLDDGADVDAEIRELLAALR
jgi:RNA polymerase sigma-70 factor (ECF subfamily)